MTVGVIVGAVGASLFRARKVISRGGAHKTSATVNKAPKFTIRPVPYGLFRAMAGQKAIRKACAIKAKLSGFL